MLIYQGAYKQSVYYGIFKTPLTWIDSPSGMVIVHSLELSQLPKWTQTSLLLRDKKIFKK